jgi:hypothetical protein
MSGPLASSGQVRRRYYLLSAGHFSLNSLHYGTLILSLAAATGDFRIGMTAFFIQQPLEALSELLTGGLADRRGRRFSVVLGLCALAAAGGSFLLATLPNQVRTTAYVSAIFGQGLYLFGSACVSKALDAWISDYEKWARAPWSETEKIFVVSNVFRNLSAALVGGAALWLGISAKIFWVPWASAAVGFAVLAILAARWMEEPYRESSHQADATGDSGRLVEGGASFVWQDKEVRRHTLLWTAQYGFWAIITYFWLRILAESATKAGLDQSVPLETLLISCWVLWVGVRLAASLLTFWVRHAPFYSRKMGSWMLFGSAILAPLSFLIEELLVRPERQSSATWPLYFVAVVVLIKACEVTLAPLRTGRINERLGPRSRALCLSFSMAGGTLVAFLVLCAFWFLNGHLPFGGDEVATAATIAAGVALAGAAVYWPKEPAGNSAKND